MPNQTLPALLTLLSLVALSPVAMAADEPGIYVRQAVGTGGWPTGLMSETRVQYRAPLKRVDDSLMLNDTYVGAGAMVRVTPAFSEFGPRVSFAPVDIFDVDLQASRLQYYSGRYGLMPFDAISGKTGAERGERADNGDGVSSGGWSFTVSPTAKIKVGPVIAFSSWNIAHVMLDTPEGVTAAYTYEPLRDMVVSWNDTTFDHEAGALYAVVDPEDDGGLFYMGVLARDRFQTVSPDRHTSVGPILVMRPSTAPAVPKMVLRSMFYVTESDRVGGAPNTQLAAIWEVGG